MSTDTGWAARYDELATLNPFGGPLVSQPMSGPFVDRGEAAAQVFEARAEELETAIAEFRAGGADLEGTVTVAELRVVELREKATAARAVSVR